MKKRILLILGICLSLAFFFSFLNKEKKKEISFYESLENEEVFGDSFGEVNLNLKDYKLCNSESLIFPKIGYQSVLNQDSTKISIRYTALISDLNINASWTRALYDSNGAISDKLLKATKEVTKCYTGITNNGVITYASDYEDSNGNHPYNYFVVYSLLDIPLATYSNYYLDAYLTISNDDESITTKAGALRIDQGDFFTYEINEDLSFSLDDGSYKVEGCNKNNYGTLIVPSYYSSDTNRLKVTKIASNILYDKNIDYLVLPNTILEIEKDICNANSIVNYLCYLGTYLEFDNVKIGNNPYFESKIIYFYDEDLTYCNSFKLENDVVTISDASHTLTTKEENVTATCTLAGTYDLVTYCSVCGIEIDREEKEKEALGHFYDEDIITNNLGHSYIKHECDYCNDTYYTNLAVDYTKTYEYETLTTNALYSEYKSDIESIYSGLYSGCMEFLNNQEDLTANWNSNSEYLIAEASFSTLTSTQAWVIANAFMDNNPQFYFVSNSVYVGTDAVYLVLDESFYSYQARKDMNDSILKTEELFTREFLNNGFTNDIDRAKFIHDYIAEELFYQYESDGKTPSNELFAHSIIGFMDLDKETGGVCECYAKTYLYLCRLVGVEAILISGYGGQSTLGGHAWNYTKIDGVWYGTDVTWDDDDEYDNIYYTYFLASQQTMDYESYSNTSHLIDLTDLSLIADVELEDYNKYFQVLLPELSSVSGYN